jgi:hypothetical protein
MVHQDYPEDETSKAFFKALVGEDHLGFVIRAHIHIEHCLRRLIEIAIPHPEHLDVDQLNYPMAACIVTSLGLNSRFNGPLRAPSQPFGNPRVVSADLVDDLRQPLFPAGTVKQLEAACRPVLREHVILHFGAEYIEPQHANIL